MVNRRRDTLRFHIELLGIQPPIWRELLVPARYTFWELHVAIQNAMGWHDYHLHEFHVETERGPPAVFGLPDDEGFAMSEPARPGWEYSVVDFVSVPNTVMRYDGTVRLAKFWVHDRPQGAGKFLIRRFPKAD